MNIYDFDLEKLKEIVASYGYEEYRAKQLFLELYKGKKLSDISSLPKKLINLISENYNTNPINIVKHLKSTDGTEKFLMQVFDGNIIECVLMKYSYGNTLCISTQAGCKMGCAFCASTIGGLKRNLTAGEFLGQVFAVNNLYEKEKRFITNVVLMGSGEPLDNYDNTVKFLRLISDENGINISLRNISLSTCGIVPKIYDFAKLKLPVTLAFSMHSPFDHIRQSIMPIAKKYSLKETIKALKFYFKETGRRVIIEYSMIKDKNISIDDAKELKRILKGLNCHINLIMLNPVKESILKPCSRAEAENFKKMLEKENLSVTIRRQIGIDIEGACGQLRRKYIKE